MTDHVQDSIAAGLIAGDPQQIGLMIWAAVHGVVVLQLGGLLPPGTSLSHMVTETLMRGLKPTA